MATLLYIDAASMSLAFSSWSSWPLSSWSAGSSSVALGVGVRLPCAHLGLANEASGRGGLASTSGSACDRRRHAGAVGPRRPCPPRARSTDN